MPFVDVVMSIGALVIVLFLILVFWKDRSIVLLGIKNLSRRRLRNILTTLGLIFAVSLYVSINVGMNSVIVDRMRSIEETSGAIDIVITAKNASEFDDSLIEKLEGIEGIEFIAPRIGEMIMVYNEDIEDYDKMSVLLVGIDPDLDLKFGEIKSNSGEVLNYEIKYSRVVVCDILLDEDSLGTDLKKADIIQTEHLLENYSISKVPLNVTGIADTSKGIASTENNGRAIYVTLKKAQEIFDIRGKITKIIINLEREYVGNPELVGNKVQERLGSNFRLTYLKKEQQKNMNDQLNVIRRGYEFIATMVLLSVTFLIFNSMYMTVSERTYEIGVLRAIGSRKFQIFRIIFYEIFVIGITSSALGVFVGLYMAHGIIFLWALTWGRSAWTAQTMGEFSLESIEVVYDNSMLIQGFGIGLALTVLASMYPVLEASNKNIIHALRPATRPPGKKISKKWMIISVPLAIVGGINAYICFAAGELVQSSYYCIFAIIGLSLLVGQLSKSVATIVNGTSMLSVGTFIYWTSAQIQVDVGLETTFMLLVGSIVLTGYLLFKIGYIFSYITKHFFRTVSYIAPKNLGRNAIRSSFNLGIFAVCMSMIVVMGVILDGLQFGIEELNEKYFGTDLIIYSNVGLSPTFSANLTRDIEGVRAAAAIEGVGVDFKHEKGSITHKNFSALLGINSSTYFQAAKPAIEEPVGANVTALIQKLGKGNYCILSEPLAEDLDARVGDQIQIWSEVEDDWLKFEMIAITQNAFMGYPQGYFGYVDIFHVFEKFDDEDENLAHTFFVKCETELSNGTKVDPKTVATEIEKKYKHETDIEIMVLSEALEDSRADINRSFLFFQAIELIAVLIAFLTMTTTMIQVVSERKREIGLLRGIGASEKSVIGTIIFEAVIISTLGVFIGIFNGIIIGSTSLIFLGETLGFELPLNIPWGSIQLVIIGGIITSVISSALPGWRVSQIIPAEALRYSE